MKLPWQQIVGLVALGVALLATVPHPYHSLDHGLDPSYQWGLNRAAADGLVHGRDLTYTYGPLGYLLYPVDLGSNLAHGLVAQWVLWLLLGWTLYTVVRRTPDGRGVILAAAVAVAQGLRLPLEYLWVFTLAILLVRGLDAGSGSLRTGVVAGGLAAFLVFVKFTAGVTAVAMVLIGAVALAERRSREAYRVIGAMVVGFWAILLVVVATHFGGVTGFARWLQLSAEIARGYSTSMSLQGRGAELALGTGMLFCFVAIAGLWSHFRSSALAAVAISFPPVAVAYKHAFVRQATHAPIFFPVAFLFLAALVPLADSVAARRSAVALLAVATLLVGGEVGVRPAFGASASLATAVGLDGCRNLVSLFRPGAVRRQLATASREKLQAQRLPAEWTALLRDRSVDVVPYELSLIPANDLSWRPNPSMQSYSAYTRRLDRNCAAHFAGPNAPDFVIFHFATIDLRHPLLDTPETAQALLRHYRTAGTDEGEQRVLLRRQAEVSRPDGGIRGEPVSKERAVFGDWVVVPDTAVPLVAELLFRPLWQQRILAILFRSAPISIQVEDEREQTQEYRLLPDTVAGGLLLSHLPRAAGGTAAVFAGRPSDRVVRFRIGGSGAIVYDPEYTVSWAVASSRR